MSTLPSFVQTVSVPNSVFPVPGVRPVWDDAQAEFYMEGISRSDYGQAVGGRLRELLGGQTELLDVGAGAGTMGLPLLTPGARWTAVEPSPFLAGYLNRHGVRWACRPAVIQATWQSLGQGEVPVHDAALAANTCGPLDDTRGFWRWMRSHARRVMVWVVPAQEGPHGVCLSGFLAPDLHGEDMTPPIRGVLERLGDDLKPDRMETVDWTFRYRFADHGTAKRYFQQRFNECGDHSRECALSAYLEENLKAVPGGVLASAPKRSACLIWHLGEVR